MKKISFGRHTLTSALILAVGLICNATAQKSSNRAALDDGGNKPGGNGNTAVPAYLDTSLSFQARAADLVLRMTLSEKISQMQNYSRAIPSLGIPVYNWWSECLHGVARNGIATVFPQAIGMAATWDPELIYKEAEVISTEARAKYNYAISKGEHERYEGLTFWAPNINIDRDPRWGRGQETYGEDPYLTSEMAVAFVRGLQGNNPKYFKVIATPKHFDAYSGPEPLRHTFSATVTKSDWYDTYLPAFEAAVREGGVYSVMGAYNSINGVPCCANPFLLTYLLRDKWGFKGYVVSDCGAIGDIYLGHKFAPSLAAASALAVKAGCDLSCGGEYSTLPQAVKDGLISERDIDTAVTRLMMARLKLGMFDPKGAVPYDTITIAENNTPAHQELARKVADESIVLLKNAGNTLPLSKNLKSVAVIGAYATDLNILLGDYHGTPSNPVNILQGIKNKLGPDVNVNFAPGYNMLEDRIDNPVTIGSQYLTPEGGLPLHGLYAEYFDNPDLKGEPVLTRVDTMVSPYWGLNSPGKGVPPHYFSLRWTGTLTPPVTGQYKLGIVTDEKGRLYLDGKLIVDNWNPYQINVFKSKTVTLEKGKRYNVKIEYADSGDFAGIRFQWHLVPNLPPRQTLINSAVALAKKSDVVIAVAGISPQLESEENNNINFPGFKGGDRTRLRLPAGEEALLKALHKTGKKIVLVLVGGSALAVDWEEKNIPAILDSWYPGEEGGNAVADVLFGGYNPAGRLPVTFYRSVRDLPPFSDYSMQGRTYRYFKGKPLFPFGFGLSYTKFDYSDLKLNETKAKPGDTLRVSVKIRNAGEWNGDEVVQIYVRNLTAKGPMPIESLVRFDRVSIKEGEAKTVTLLIPVRSFKIYDAKKDEYVVAPGKYRIQVGASSSDIRLTKVMRVME